MEPEVQNQIDPAIYKKHLALLESGLDIGEITGRLKRVRGK